MNTGGHASFSVWFPQGICPVVGLQGHVVVLLLVILRTLHTVLHNDYVNIHSHQQSKRVPFFDTLSSAFTVYRFFDDGHFDWCEVISIIVFGLHFSNTEQC